eukprot:TRINITY_DN18304_c1_g1_i1.p4 TRINITY_DN18304_c1_g1~~TRINITY_DN18304_c1_g1_i1.p4  ORF type:complete len:210 (+),score=45.70 TRINITY_DN18304_c1_g1_i1:72-701(+)
MLTTAAAIAAADDAAAAAHERQRLRRVAASRYCCPPPPLQGHEAPPRREQDGGAALQRALAAMAHAVDRVASSPRAGRGRGAAGDSGWADSPAGGVWDCLPRGPTLTAYSVPPLDPVLLRPPAPARAPPHSAAAPRREQMPPAAAAAAAAVAAAGEGRLDLGPAARHRPIATPPSADAERAPAGDADAWSDDTDLPGCDVASIPRHRPQ